MSNTSRHDEVPQPARSCRARRGGVLAVVLAATLAAAPNAVAASADGGMLPVPSVTIMPGERVAADMLTQKFFYYDPTRPLAVLEDASPAIGMVARRTLVAGKPIPKNAFGEPELVKRGTLTEARFTMGGLTIRATVLPLENGSLGDLVKVRNIDSGRVITGVVDEDGAIVVGVAR